MADLSDNGFVYIGDAPIGEVFYWLSLDTEPGPVVAEGSISGSEEMMRQIQAAQQVRLVLHDGPVFSLVPDGGSSGTRWVRLFAL